MADRTPAPDTPELRARWGAFAWTPENKKTADWHIAKYPEGRQRSAVMPLLDAIDSEAAAIGAVNTVIVNPEGMEVARLIGGADWSAPETLAVLDALR